MAKVILVDQSEEHPNASTAELVQIETTYCRKCGFNNYTNIGTKVCVKCGKDK